MSINQTCMETCFLIVTVAFIGIMPQLSDKAFKVE